MPQTRIIAKRIHAGFYTYTLGDKVVEVVDRDPNPAFGDTKRMRTACALWTRNLITDPVESKREAAISAHAMLRAA